MNQAHLAASSANVTPIRRDGDVPCTERLLRLPQVLNVIGLGKTTLYDMMKVGEFPQPRKVRHLSLWVESEVQQWVRSVVEPAAD